MTQGLGFGRAVGQVYAYLFFNSTPRSLADLQNDLGISKGSASMAVRQLEQWHAVQQVWVKGDRKDYYEANDWFGRILKNALMDAVGKKIMAFSSMLDEADAALEAVEGDGEESFIRQRVQRLRTFQTKAGKTINSPVVSMLSK